MFNPMINPVLYWTLPVALSMLLLAMACACVRLLKGPAAQDRILALDCMYLNGMLALLVLGIIYNSNHFFEAALLIALLGFVSSTAMAKFLLRGEIIE
jgi:multicomponent K+:H+ antiporter subunit F